MHIGLLSYTCHTDKSEKTIDILLTQKFRPTCKKDHGLRGDWGTVPPKNLRWRCEEFASLS